jgi:hypothetical protein
MIKRICGLLLAVVFLISAGSMSFGIVKGFMSKQQELVKLGENVEVPAGAEVKTVVVIGGSATIYGNVVQDVVAVGGSVYLKDSAVVGGDVVSVGGKIVRDPLAAVKGDQTEVDVSGVSPMFAFLAKGGLIKGAAFLSIMGVLSLILLAILLIALFTPQLGMVSALIERQVWRTFLWGLLVLILIVPVVVVLAVSIIGIVFIPVWLILIAAAAIFGYFAAAQLVGKVTLKTFRLSGKPMIIEAIVGILFLWLIGLIPFVGWLVKLVATGCGLGAVALTRFGIKEA